MEHDEKALPIDIRLLGALAEKVPLFIFYFFFQIIIKLYYCQCTLVSFLQKKKKCITNFSNLMIQFARDWDCFTKFTFLFLFLFCCVFFSRFAKGMGMYYVDLSLFVFFVLFSDNDSVCKLRFCVSIALGILPQLFSLIVRLIINELVIAFY